MLAGERARRRAVMRNMSLAAGFVLVPFTLVNLQNDFRMGMANVLIVVGFFIIGLMLTRGKPLPFDGAEILVLAACVTAMSIIRQHQIGVYWSFVLIPAIHFALPRKTATPANIIYIIVISGLSAQAVGVSDAIRIFCALGLSSWISGFFAAKVEKHQNMLSALAIIDPLTETYNRRHLEQMMDDAAQQHTRYGVPFSVIVYDLDHFKKVNDELGHETGDLALQELCRIVCARVRKTDVVFRYGGEEFVILLRHTKADKALEVAKDLIEIISKSEIIPNRKLTMSCGVSEYRAKEASNDLIRRADEALYEAKRLGRNRAHLAARDRRSTSVTS